MRWTPLRSTTPICGPRTASRRIERRSRSSSASTAPAPSTRSAPVSTRPGSAATSSSIRCSPAAPARVAWRASGCCAAIPDDRRARRRHACRRHLRAGHLRRRPAGRADRGGGRRRRDGVRDGVSPAVHARAPAAGRARADPRHRRRPRHGGAAAGEGGGRGVHGHVPPTTRSWSARARSVPTTPSTTAPATWCARCARGWARPTWWSTPSAPPCGRRASDCSSRAVAW